MLIIFQLHLLSISLSEGGVAKLCRLTKWNGGFRINGEAPL